MAELTFRQLDCSRLDIAQSFVHLLPLLFGGSAAGGGGGGQHTSLLRRSGGAQLSRVGFDADAQVAGQRGHAVNLTVVRLAVVGGAAGAVKLCRLAQPRRIALLAGWSGQLGHRVAVGLRIHQLDHAQVLGQLESRVELQLWIEVAALVAFEQSAGQSGGERRQRQRNQQAESAEQLGRSAMPLASAPMRLSTHPPLASRPF